jgi:DNA-binding NtrC family response regulator
VTIKVDRLHQQSPQCDVLAGFGLWKQMVTTHTQAAITHPVLAMPLSTLLVIDDDESFLAAFCALLESELPCKAHHLPDPSQVMRVVQTLQPQVALIDLAFPGLDGETILTDLRAHHPAVVVGILSASADAESARRCLRSGADDYISKCLPPAIILQRVSDLLLASQARIRPRKRVGQAHADAAIRTAMHQAKGRVSIAAAHLGISRQALYKRLRSLSWKQTPPS